MINFTLRQLEFLVGAGQYGNLSEAAQHLNITQPAITSAISHMEQVLGYKLFHRVPGTGVTPTAAGQRVLAQARKILVEINNFQNEFKQAPANINGSVALACFEPLACLRLPGVLKTLSENLPGVTVDFTLCSQKRIRAGLQTGEFEIGLSYDSGFWEDLVKFELYRVVPSALLPANHTLANKPSIAVAELSEEPFILVDLPESREFQLALMGRFGLEPRVRYYCGNIEVIRGIVANGLAVSISVTHPAITQSYDGHELAIVPFSDPVPTQAVVVAHSRTGHLTHAAAAVISMLRAYFQPYSGGQGG